MSEKNSRSKKISFKQEPIPLVIILLFTLITFSGVLNNGFTDWDDDLYVTQNEIIKSLDSENINRMFTELVAELYTPLTIFSYAIDYEIYGMNPKGFHGTNLFLHMINCILVFYLLRKWTDNKWLLFGAALLFSVHPLNTEAVSWISGRKDLLFSIFYLGGLLAYYEYRNEKNLIWMVLTSVLFVFSLLSKPVALTFPFVLLLIDYYADRKINLKSIIEKAHLILISLGFFGLGIYLVQKVNAFEMAPVGYSFIDKISLAAYAFAFYLYSSLIPFSLSNFHSYPHFENGSLDMIYYISPFFLIILAFLLYKYRKSHSEILFSFLFFSFVIGPTLRFIPTGYPIVSERYYYLASVGLLFAIVKIIQLAAEKIKFNPQFSTLFLILPLAILFGFKTKERVKDWKNNISLWESALEDDPTLHLAHTHLARAYDNFGNDDRALIFYEKALGENPNQADILNSAGVIYQNKGINDKAYVYFSKAIELDQSSELPFYNRGNILKANKEWKKSIDDYNTALKIKPNFPEAYNNRGISYIMLQDTLNALKDFETAVKLDSQNEMYVKNLNRLKAAMKR